MDVTELQLGRLLNESVDSAIRRERRVFDRALASAAAPIVLFGAGSLGRRVLAAMRADAQEPACFADENTNLWGRTIDGLTVVSPQRAARKFGGEVVFVVTIWRQGHSFVRTRDRLRTLLTGSTVISVLPLLWKYGLACNGVDLPHKVLENAGRVRECFSLWADDRSRKQFVAHLRWRLLADYDALLDPDPNQYFPQGLFTLGPDEFFVDCGAYDGDTLREFLVHTGDSFRGAVALEPDPANFAGLKAYSDSLSAGVRERVRLFEFAAAAAAGQVRFNAGCGLGSAIGDSGKVFVDCDCLDHVLAEHDPTYLKMDVEGAELDALAGARQTIARCHPILAISLYHCPDDVWRIPLYLQSVLPSGYSLFLRSHAYDGLELCCYAVPSHRLAG